MHQLKRNYSDTYACYILHCDVTFLALVHIIYHCCLISEVFVDSTSWLRR